MDAALEEMRNIKSEYNDSIKSFLSSVKSKLDAAKTADMILAKMRGNLDKMMKSLDEREATLDNYKHIQAEIEDFVSQLA
jgi:DNA helicase IV